MTAKLRVKLYRADRRPGLRSIGGVRSWTTSREYAERYQAGYYGESYGGRHLYLATATIDAATAVDLRHPESEDEVGGVLASVMEMMGVDNLQSVPVHVLLREAVRLLQSLGTRWVVFTEYAGFDEWLSLGRNRLRVAELTPVEPG